MTRESLGSFVLGSLSVAVGIVVVVAAIPGIARRPFAGWSPQWGAVASIVGEGLGLAGIIAAQISNRSISWISALGTTMCLIYIYISLMHAWFF